MNSHHTYESKIEKSHERKVKQNSDLNRFPNTEDPYEGSDIVEESDIESEEEGRQVVIRKKLKTWHQKEAEKTEENNSVKQEEKEAEENSNVKQEEEDGFDHVREALRNEAMNVLKIYFYGI